LITYRRIIKSDNSILAGIIRNGIESLQLPKEGTAHSDPTTNDLYSLFQKANSYYIVVEEDGAVKGGCGVYPSDGLPETHAELVRFFLDESIRGKGVGKELMKQCEQIAIDYGYEFLYLESFPEMEAAIHLYEMAGYKRLNNPLGNTGHFSCNVWMEKKLIR